MCTFFGVPCCLLRDSIVCPVFPSCQVLRSYQSRYPDLREENGEKFEDILGNFKFSLDSFAQSVMDLPHALSIVAFFCLQFLFAFASCTMSHFAKSWAGLLLRGLSLAWCLWCWSARCQSIYR